MAAFRCALALALLATALPAATAAVVAVAPNVTVYLEVSSAGALAWWPTSPLCSQPAGDNATIRLSAELTNVSSNDAGDLRNGLRIVGNLSTHEETLQGDGLAIFGSLLRGTGSATLAIRCLPASGSEAQQTVHVTALIRSESMHSRCLHRLMHSPRSPLTCCGAFPCEQS